MSASVGKYVQDVVVGADVVGDVGPVAVHGEGAVHGHPPLRSGVVLSTTGMRLDLAALWERIGR